MMVRIALQLAGLLAGVVSPTCTVHAQTVGDIARDCVVAGGPLGPCFGEETVIWEGRVATAVANLDDLDPSTFLQRQPQLRAAMEAFWAYRDAMCDFEAMAWPGMSGAGEAWAECRMQVTAAHALRLETLHGAME